jgi:ribonucleoside-diphosphate reductase beta chain
MGEVQLAEARASYGFQTAMENIHSEMYSILIDTYIKDSVERDRLFHAIENFRASRGRRTGARSRQHGVSFAERLVAFAVEGVFQVRSRPSTGSKGNARADLLQRTSRDEALHTEFAVLMYSRLNTKLSQTRIYEIIKDAVEIEKEFITDAIPCRMIGMNSTLMIQYIEFVADRLVVQLGYEKIFNSANLRLHGTHQHRVQDELLEKRVSEYSLSDKTIDDNIFMSAAF